MSFPVTHKSEIKPGLYYLQLVRASAFQGVNERLRRGIRKERPGNSSLHISNNCSLTSPSHEIVSARAQMASLRICPASDWPMWGSFVHRAVNGRDMTRELAMVSWLWKHSEGHTSAVCFVTHLVSTLLTAAALSHLKLQCLASLRTFSKVA